MFQEAAAGMELLSLPILALFLFIGTFCIATVMVWRQEARDPELHAHLAGLPLEDDATALEEPSNG